MRYLIKTLILALVAIMLLMPISRASLSWSSIDGQARGFIANGAANGGNLITESSMKPLVGGLANILTTIGAVIVLAGLLIIGIKYMVATPDEAAKLKTKLVGLAVSGVVILGAYGIWKLVGEFLQRNNWIKRRRKTNGNILHTQKCKGRDKNIIYILSKIANNYIDRRSDRITVLSNICDGRVRYIRLDSSRNICCDRICCRSGKDTNDSRSSSNEKNRWRINRSDSTKIHEVQ